MSRFSLFWILFALPLLSLLPAQAKVFTFTTLNCHCEVPDSWTFVDVPRDAVNVVDYDRKRSFLLRVAPVNRTVTLDNTTFLNGLQKPFITEGYNITGSQEVPLQGVKFHEFTMTKDLGNRTSNVCVYVTLADGYGYYMELHGSNLNPDQDDESKAIVNSFDFIKPPTIHATLGFSDIFTPRDGIQHDTNYLAGYRTGIIVALLMLLLCPLLVLGAVGYGIYCLVSRDRPSRPRYPNMPPPPPVYTPPPPRRPPE